MFNIFTKAKDFNRSATIVKQQAYFNNISNTCNIYKLQLFEANYTLVYNNNVYLIILIYYND